MFCGQNLPHIYRNLMPKPLKVWPGGGDLVNFFAREYEVGQLFSQKHLIISFLVKIGHFWKQIGRVVGKLRKILCPGMGWNLIKIMPGGTQSPPLPGYVGQRIERPITDTS